MGFQLRQLGSLIGQLPRSQDPDGGTQVDAGNLLLSLSVKSLSVLDPVSNPQIEDAYLIPTSATGEWSTRVGQIAIWADQWLYLTPKNGWSIYVEDDAVYKILVADVWGTVTLT